MTKRDAVVGPVSLKLLETTKWVNRRLGLVGAAMILVGGSPLTLLDQLVPQAPRLSIYVRAELCEGPR